MPRPAKRAALRDRVLAALSAKRLSEVQRRDVQRLAHELLGEGLDRPPRAASHSGPRAGARSRVDEAELDDVPAATPLGDHDVHAHPTSARSDASFDTATGPIPEAAELESAA